MFCKSCGTQIDDDSVFCSYCGTKQSDINKPIPNNSALGQAEPQTVNVNLSFERQSSAKTASSETLGPKQPQYDLTYEKETDATIFGVILLVVSFILIFIGPFKFDNEESYNQFRVFSSIGALVIRIIAIVWVVNITKRQNREPFLWGLLTFFLPSIGLIIIGQLRKLYRSNSINRLREEPDKTLNETEIPEYKIISTTNDYNSSWGWHTIIRISHRGNEDVFFKHQNKNKYFLIDKEHNEIYFNNLEEILNNLYQSREKDNR